MELTIALCGDIMLGAEVAECMGSATVVDWLAGISSAWSGADLLIGNLECPCVIEAKPVEGPLPELIFHAPASRLSELADAGFSAVTLANNHILNCGALGLLETIQGLEEVGISHVGAGMNLAEAIQPAFIPVGGLIVGIVAFCYGPPAGRSSPGVALCEPGLMRRGLAMARAGADLVIAVLHDGLEYSDVPPAKTRGRFRFLAENGADIVIGHHPHVLQGLEWYGHVLIAYSLGDFLFHNSLAHVAARNFSRIAMGRYAPEEVRRDPGKFSRGAVLTVHILGNKKSTQWHPFRQDPNLRPQLSLGDTKFEDLHRLEGLSTALLNEKDSRHAIADSVFKAAWLEYLDTAGIRQVIRLARKPKWRYLPHGLTWLYRKVRRIAKARDSQRLA
jgi:poly-gamma-glutamate capsule biosynthesis protein CapA/YwtB (metallophosphatase superfamily)